MVIALLIHKALGEELLKANNEFMLEEWNRAALQAEKYAPILKEAMGKLQKPIERITALEPGTHLLFRRSWKPTIVYNNI